MAMPGLDHVQVHPCRGCGSDGWMPLILDLGNQHLPDFTDPGTLAPPKWPLKLVQCPRCTLLQLSASTPRGLLYHDRYGFESGVNEAIRRDLRDIVDYALEAYGKPMSWLDIAGNDGTLLSFVPSHAKRIGIDPVVRFAQSPLYTQSGASVISDYFTPGYFKPGEFDIITSISMFYDLDDPRKFAREVASVLATRGVWVIQQNYARDMMVSNAVDNVCHEHVTYFTLRSLLPVLEQAGLEINDATYSTVNGGCIRTMVSHRGAYPVSPSVQQALNEEHELLLHDPEMWDGWGSAVRSELQRTKDYLTLATEQGAKVYVYGASTRGGTILQTIGAGPELLPFAVERNPAKFGKVMAATGIPIISEEEMRKEPPDALLVSPWFFRDVFVDREREFLLNGGEMVFPLPQFEVVTGSLE